MAGMNIPAPDSPLPWTVLLLLAWIVVGLAVSLWILSRK
jgi:hypothetical protein